MPRRVPAVPSTVLSRRPRPRRGYRAPRDEPEALDALHSRSVTVSPWRAVIRRTECARQAQRPRCSADRPRSWHCFLPTIRHLCRWFLAMVPFSGIGVPLAYRCELRRSPRTPMGSPGGLRSQHVDDQESRFTVVGRAFRGDQWDGFGRSSISVGVAHRPQAGEQSRPHLRRSSSFAMGSQFISSHHRREAKQARRKSGYGTTL